MKVYQLLFAFLVGVLFGLSESCHADTIGFDIGSIHSNNYDRVAQRNWNDFNPGVYYRHDNLVVGSFYNSVRQQSFYGGYVYALGSHVDLLIGGISGYNGVGPGGRYAAKGLMPMVVPMVHWRLWDSWSGRVSILPQVARGGASAVHLSVEYNF